MPDPETTLAMTAATTIVAAMATSAWQTARAGASRLFRRGGEEEQGAAAARLDDDAVLVARSEDAGRARQALIAAWQLRLEDVLRRHPDAGEEMSALVDQIGSVLPQVERAWVQTNVARDGGHIFAAQGGNVIIHHASPDRTAAPRPEDDR
ncbi:hypothetical protein ACWC09_16435 [Streptomyces sp. NPDC001617]